jgi:hypothetical protein
MCEDRTHRTTFDFDLNGIIIKWGCVRNKILKNACMYETAAAEEKEKKNTFNFLFVIYTRT